jgi:hypothetical protein
MLPIPKEVCLIYKNKINLKIAKTLKKGLTSWNKFGKIIFADDRKRGSQGARKDL